MSQVTIFDIERNNPQIPTRFDANMGFAVPLANVLEIFGDTALAGIIPVQTVGVGNNITTYVQISQAIAATDATKIGLAAFDSADFTVDANGFVSIIGSASTDAFNVDASTAPGTDPVVPDAFGVITVTGGQVAAGTVGANVIRTNSVAANEYTIEIQRSSAVVASASANNGVSHFNSIQFTIDPNGFVSMMGSSVNPGILGVHPNATSGAGTNPTIADGSGNISILAGTIAAGTNPARTVATAANSITTQIQISQALAATDVTKIGLSNFDSVAFDVDANGFVQLNGGGIATTSFDVQTNTAPGTDPVVPSAAGVVTINGAVVANHSVVLETRSRAANAYNLEIQYAAAAAATDGTKSGVAHFDSSSFSVDASGFVTLAGGGEAIDSIKPNSGTDPVVPTGAGLVSILGTGSITTIGSLNTLTISLTGLTNHAVLVGAGTATITNVGPTSTAGQVLQSAGASADPAFSTATYPSTTTINQLLYSSSANVVSGLTAANSASLVSTSTGVPVWSGTMTNGQMIIGSTGATPAAGTITSTGGTITVSVGAGTLNLEVAGGGFAWNNITAASATMAKENGYQSNNAGLVTLTMPSVASSTFGDTIKVGGLGAGGWLIQCVATQLIHMGSTATAAAGSIASTNRYDQLELVCSSTTTEWFVRYSVGNLTIT